MSGHDPDSFLVAKRMHHLQLETGEQVPTWFLVSVDPELYSSSMKDAALFNPHDGLELVCRLGPGHWLAHTNGQAYAYQNGRITASIPLEQLP